MFEIAASAVVVLLVIEVDDPLPFHVRLAGENKHLQGAFTRLSGLKMRRDGGKTEHCENHGGHEKTGGWPLVHRSGGEANNHLPVRRGVSQIHGRRGTR
ncbi:MAG: hypothetical protein HQ581_17435 [Planctomycetes bacterium]|nr:hypothetical protein [Planctomycetota bacterium]